MEVTETRADGLVRELQVTVPAATLDAKLNAYLDDLKGKVQLKGFRPGKVPMAHLRKMYGRSAMAEVVNEVMTQSVRDAVETRDEKPALQPDVDIDQASMTEVLEGKRDLSFAIKYEVLPEFEVAGLDTIAVEKPVYRVPDEEVDTELQNLADRFREFEPVERPAETGDRLKIDFVGTIDGVEFDGGKAEGVDITIGEGRFIPGFEEQLTGASAGDARTVTVTFPEAYPAQELAGKPAEFAVTVHEVAAPKAGTVDDALAARLGMDDLGKLREALRGQMQGGFDRALRQRVKRALLDALDARFQFQLPQKLVETEFDAIWKQVERDMAERGETFDASLADGADGSEAKTRAEYRKIAERRVRLGLLLSEVGTAAKVEVTDEEVSRALNERLRQFPGQEKQVVEFYRKNPQAVASLRAPIFEDKVIDYMLELVNVTEVPVSKDELMKDLEDHDHDHDHAHDHGAHAHDHAHDHDHDHAHDHDHGHHHHHDHDHAHDHGHDHGHEHHDHGHTHR